MHPSNSRQTLCLHQVIRYSLQIYKWTLFICSAWLLTLCHISMLLLNSSYLLRYILPTHLTDHATCYVHKKLLGFYDFKTKQPEGMCRAAVFALHVKEELASWPEQSTRQRSWLTVPEAAERSRHPWMQEALVTGFSAWLENWSDGGCCVNLWYADTSQNSRTGIGYHIGYPYSTDTPGYVSRKYRTI